MNQSKEKEYLLRGRTISLSAQIETVVAGILLISNIGNSVDELVQLRGVMMNEKLKKAKRLLKEFHPEIYKVEKPILKRYIKISAFRNQMAHCVFDWDDPTLLSFCVVDIIEDKEDGDYFDKVRYTIVEAFAQLELLQRVVEDLAIVNEMIMKKGSYAELFSLLSQVKTSK